MKALYDSNGPFETFVDQIEQAILIRETAVTPYTAEQVAIISYNVLSCTGMFDGKCKDWRKQAPATKTWTNMKLDFGTAYHDLMKNHMTACLWY